MKLPRLLIAAFLSVVAGVASVPAASVRPPDWTALIQQADAVVRGEVIAVRSEWRGSGPTRRIMTIVTLAVERRLVGEAPSTWEIELLGGQVGDDKIIVSGMPRFQVGDRDILFVENNGRQVCPLVGFGHGRYLIVEGATAGEAPTVARENGVPLESVDEVATPLVSAAAARLQTRFKRAPLTVAEFEHQVIARAVELGRVDVNLDQVQR